MVINNLDLCQRFADARGLHAIEITHLRDSGFIYSDGVSYMLTEQGRNLITSNRVAPLGEGSSQCPDDDSYLAPTKHSPFYFDLDRNKPIADDGKWQPSRVAQPDVLVAQVAINAGLRGSLEQDPNGKGQHETGAKLDAGKVRLGLVLGAFSNALVEVGKVGTYGAQKYTDNGWLDVPKGKARYTDALLRHIFTEANESHDPDTNLHHAAHAAWNALARLELILRKRGDE